jgi:hypothetical protein
MDSLPTGSIQSWLIVAAVALSTTIIVLWATSLAGSFVRQREMRSEPPSEGGTGITQ